jgi:hypothetical protein
LNHQMDYTGTIDEFIFSDALISTL